MAKHYFVVLFTLVVAFMVVEDAKGSSWETNSTRRALHECAANNVIDKCWRCKPDWAEKRQALAYCACGFAKGTTGGLGGDIYVVTDPSDDDAANPKPGTLRCGVTQNRPLWIIFDKDMVITLKHELVINSDKTIDGRGACVQIAYGAGLTIPKVCNVIIHGIHIHHIIVTEGGLIKSTDGPPGFRHKSDGDGMCIFGSSRIWIDHCTLDNGADGLIDVTLGSTAVTISNCLFTHHEKLILLGADDKHEEDKNMQVTVAFNKFSTGCDQRMPRCRFGFFQVVNNNYEGWGTYAIGGSANPTILSHGNRFVAPNDPFKKNVLVRANAPEAESMQWDWRSEKDVLENGAIFVPSGCDPQLTHEQLDHLIPAEPGENVLQLTSCAGVLRCVPGLPC